MKTIVFGLAAGCCLFFSHTVLSQNNCKELSEKGVKLVARGSFEDAKQVLEEAFHACCRRGSPESIPCAEAWNSKGVMALTEGNASLALSFCLKADSIFKNLNATDSTEYGAILSGVANAYIGVGDLENATAYSDRAIAFALKHNGTTSRQYAFRISARANIRFKKGQIARARTDLETALHLIDSLDRYSPDFVTASLSLAGIYTMLGKFEQGLACITAGKTVADSILDEGHPIKGNIDLVTGTLLFRAGRYFQAIPVLESAYKSAARKGDIQNEGLILPCINLAMCHLMVGDLTKAEFYLNKAMQLEGASPTLNMYFYGPLRSNLAVLYMMKGRPDLALPLLQEALQNIEKNLRGKYNLEYFNTLSNLSAVYGENNQVELSENILNQCKAILDSIYDKPVQEHIMYYAALSALQTDTASLQTSQTALRLAEEYPELAQSAYYPRILINLGIDYGNLYQNDSALVYFQRAEKIYAEYKSKPMEYFSVLTGLGDAFVWKKQPEKAERYMKESILFLRDSLADRTLRHYASALSLYGFFLMKYEQPDSAQVYLQELLQVVAENLKINAAVHSEQGKIAFAEYALRFLNNPLSFALDYGKKYPDAVRSAGDAVLNLRNYSLRNSREVYETIRASGDAGLLKKYEQLISNKQILSVQYKKPKNERTLSREFLDSLAIATDLLETELVAASTTYEKETRKVTGAMVQNALLPGEAAIQFIRFNYATKGHLTDEAYYVANLYGKTEEPGSEFIFLCTETELRDRLNLGNIGSPQERIAAIYSPETKIVMGDTARTLYDLVWKKIEPRLANVHRVWLSPDGLLHQVAFDAIRENKNSAGIGASRELYYLANAADLVDRDSLFASEIGTAVLFGNIEYQTDAVNMREHLPQKALQAQPMIIAEATTERRNNIYDLEEFLNLERPRDARDKLSSLPFTKQEIQMAQTFLKRTFSIATTYQGYEALEEYFKGLGQKHPSPGLIHLATHGDYLPNDPTILNSLDKTALFFAGADSAWRFQRPVAGMEDQILRASEVAVQNLSNTKLVILSACKSGLGDVRSSEGVFGFQRAFRLAGADHLLISLWTVSDQHTAEFMEMFYRHWFAGLEVRKALGNAQAEMREKYPHPYYWAAFVLY